MVETAAPGVAGTPVPVAKPAVAANGRPQQFYPDGSAVPDVIAYHHRPEDLGIEGIVAVPRASDGDSEFFGADGLTFGDILDIINPLQHIPVISTVYRAITGDDISPGARIAGGALFGGPIGAGLAVVNAAVAESTGKDIGETVVAALSGAPEPGSPAGSGLAAAAESAAATAGPIAPAIAPSPPAPAAPAPGPTAPDEAEVAAILPPATGQPFGGAGALPFRPVVNEETANPAAAILQARAAVPSAGPVRGLGNPAPKPPPPDTAIPRVDGRLADKLAALAARTTPPVPDRPEPERPDKAEDANKTDREAETAAAPSAAPYVPASMIPQTMMTTLERYQRMKQAEAGDRSG